MTISSTTAQVTGQGNGVTTAFAYAFLIPTSADVQVTYVDASGNSTVLASSQYSISGVGSSAGGTVTYPLSGSAIPTGSSITVARVLALTQPTALANQGGYYPAVVEAAMDRIVMLIQQVLAGINTARALLFPASDVNPTQTLPPAASRANKFLAFDGQGNPVVASGTSSSPDVSANTSIATSTVTARSMAARAAEEISILDFGGNGNGIADNSAAMTLAMAYFGSGSGGGKIRFPTGTYFFASDLLIKRQLVIEGQGGIDNFGTRLNFADGKGIHVYHSSDSGTGTDGSWSIIRNLRVNAAAATVTAHGIFISGHGVRVENVSVNGFKGDGVHIVASGGVGNANNWVLSNVRCTSNGGHGFFIDGGDANAGFAHSCDASGNTGWGFYDSSFLGNTYVACHTATNALGPYKSDDANARNVFLGCYSESDQTGSSLVTPTQVIGGLHGAGFLAGMTAIFLDNSLGTALFNRGIVSSMVSGGDTVVGRIGGDAANGDIIFTTQTTYAPSGYRLHYHGADGNLQWDYNNSDGAATYQITGPSTTRTFGRAAIEPYAFQTDRLFVGSGNFARQITTSGAPPGAGQHAAGDLCFNSNPGVGNPQGWVCTVSGTPGTWVSMGNL